jgi:ketosteroid isomerase-like protein
MKLDVMQLPTYALLFTLLVFVGCRQNIGKGNGAEPGDSLKPTEKISSSKELEAWAFSVNHKRSESLKDLYTAGAVKIISADSLCTTPWQIRDYYSQKDYKIKSIESIYSTEANQDNGIYYEIIQFRTEDAKSFKQLVIWKVEKGKKLREFEFEEACATSLIKADTTPIPDRRNLWIDLCNAHNPVALVNKLYSPDALYFNHKPIIKGRQDLIKEYAYMNNENYRLTLEPLKVEMVNHTLAFEIGQCKGSYPGKYILIWKKDPKGEWYIYLDSNF